MGVEVLKAAILAGGMGKRLRPLTLEKPKPLVEVAGKPIIEWQITWLKKYGVDEIVLLVGYMKEKLIGYLGSGSRLGVKITYVVEDEPLGTAGAIKNAESVLKREDLFFVINGDIITNLNPLKMIEIIEQNLDIIAVIAAVPLRSPYGILEIDERGFIRKFIEKPYLEEYWINAGVYVMKPEIIQYLVEKGDIERTTFPKLAEENKIMTYRYRNVFWRSIDTYKDVEEVSKEIEKQGLFK